MTDDRQPYVEAARRRPAAGEGTAKPDVVELRASLRPTRARIVDPDGG